MAGVAAIALDKTVFIAGTPSGGVGVGEYLQMLDDENGRWIPLMNGSGKPISAIDATTSMGFLAFKSADKNRKTTIGYATYGERITLPVQAVKSEVTSSAGERTELKTTATAGSAGKPAGLTEIEQDILNAYLENEKEILAAYNTAFGEANGSKRTYESMVKAIMEAGNERILEAYKQQTKLGK